MGKQEPGIDRQQANDSTRKVLLSGPLVTEADRTAVSRAFDSGWIAPVGPAVDEFEDNLASAGGTDAAAALSSGTAALHLGLLLLGIRPGDEVIVQTATFAATAFAVIHAGAIPVFCDVSPNTWGLDPEMLWEILDMKQSNGRLPAAIVTVDLYGYCPDYTAIQKVASEFLSLIHI